MKSFFWYGKKKRHKPNKQQRFDEHSKSVVQFPEDKESKGKAGTIPAKVMSKSAFDISDIIA